MNTVIVRPIITEKSMQLAATGRYTFAVSIDSAKPAVSAAIAKTFNVKPISVRTITVPGRNHRSGKKRLESKSSAWKKAIITLPAGQKIDIFDVTEGGKQKNA